MPQVSRVRSHDGDEEIWKARFFIEDLVLKEDLILMLAGYAQWHTAAALAAEENVAWTSARIIDALRFLLRVYGTESKEDGHNAQEHQLAWARQQIDIVWPDEN